MILNMLNLEPTEASVPTVASHCRPEAELAANLGYQFSNPTTLRVALTHRSFHFENRKASPGHFERSEFLGDAVLDLALSEYLVTEFSKVDEGTLSKWRASLVNEESLARIARSLALGQYLYLGRSEEATRAEMRPRLLASAFEAVLAAVYLDGGPQAAKDLVRRCFASRLASLDERNEFARDFKTRLQEWSQKSFRTTPTYRLLGAEGPEHAKVFSYEVLVDSVVRGRGEGSSRKASEQAAAAAALKALRIPIVKTGQSPKEIL